MYEAKLEILDFRILEFGEKIFPFTPYIKTRE